jgi:hypothetical protein
MENEMKKYSPLVAVSLFALIAASPVLAEDNDNTSNIDQIGVNHTATSTQGGLDNENTSDIDQGLVVSGNNLSATVDQRGTDNDNDALIKQDGRNHTATVDQRGTDNDNDADVFQDGRNNTADVDQRGLDTENEVTVTQHGDTTDNPPSVPPPATLFLNTATVTPGGEDNYTRAGVGQTGSNLVATVIQN